ncbi:MAG TPA: PKD domain-containing protein, partial [Methanomassiliicoccales archaeon]|nr:PKD domain-containing protein [Methanomassiliicoccales archaeon]
MRRVAAAVLIVLFTFSTAVPGICSQIEHPLDLQENQSLADWELGSGNFNGLSQTFVVAGEPLKHVVADLNNDSRPDIAVIYNASFRIDIFYNDANGRFNYSDRTTIDMPGPVTDIAAGDVNKDLKQDLVVSCNVTGNDVFVLSQANNFDKNAPLYAIPTTSKPRALILQDLNGDSWLDIATLYYGDPPDYLPGFEVRLKSEDYDSAGSFPLYMDPLNMQQPSLFTSGDFNQDGRSDLVIGDRAIGKVVGFINGAPSGKVWTNTTNLIPANAPSALCMAQLIAGGGMDLMVAQEDSSIINIWRYSEGTFNLRTNVMDQESITSLATTDVNGDSRLDLVSVSASKHNLTVFRASTSLLYGHSNSLAFPVPYHPVHVIAYDMDSEGSEDLVVSSRASTGYGAISIYYRNGQEISNADLNRIVKDIFPTLMTLGNFNGIGNNEIAVYDPTGPTISFINEASNPGCPSAPSGILAIKSGDLDGDGYDDIAMMTANNVTVWFGGPDIFSGASRKVTVESTLPGLSSLFLGDLNNDSRPDVAVGASGGVESFWNSGTGTLYSEAQRFTLSLPGASVTSLATVTIRGAVHNDSRADLVVLNSTASRLEIYYQQSAGSVFTAASRSYLNVISGLYHLRAGDLNSDGLGDLAVLSPGKVNIYLQNPSYSQGFSGSQPIVAIDVPDGPRALELGDLDDDGALDIAIVTENSTLIAYGHDGPSFSLLTRQTAGAAPVLLSVGEMNGDGKDDLVAYSVASRAVSFYHQNNFPPIAMVAVEGTGHLEGGPVWFNAYGSTDSYSDRDHLSYHWDFADGGVANGERVLYVFQADGLYNVTLSVSDPWGGWDDAVVQVSIGDRAPTANFTFQSVPAPVEGSPVTFTDLSTTPVDPIKRWEWDFGDGTVLNRTDNQPVQHIFWKNGTFTVTLTVFDKDGSSNSVEKQLTVLDSAPDAAFSVSDYRPIEGQEVTFRDWSNRTADAIKSWSWDFGDGTWANVSGGDLQHHAYLRNGTYSVTLVVVDIDGSEDSITKEVVVLNSVPVADFEPSLSTPNEGQQVSFVDASTSFNPMVRWSWDMGDGTWCNGTSAETVLYMYRNNGTYIATLTVEDSDGDVQSISKPIIVRDTSPTIVRLYTMDGGSSYREWDNVSFGVVATPGWEDISVYQWDFQTTVFQADEGTALNSTYHRFLSP